MEPLNIGRRMPTLAAIIDTRTPEELAANERAANRPPSESADNPEPKRRGQKPGCKTARSTCFEHPVYGLTYPDEVATNPPTPDEIAVLTAEIRAGWTKAEERHRSKEFIGAVRVECEPVRLGQWDLSD